MNTMRTVVMAGFIKSYELGSRIGKKIYADITALVSKLLERYHSSHHTTQQEGHTQIEMMEIASREPQPWNDLNVVKHSQVDSPQSAPDHATIMHAADRVLWHSMNEVEQLGYETQTAWEEVAKNKPTPGHSSSEHIID